MVNSGPCAERSSVTPSDMHHLPAQKRHHLPCGTPDLHVLVRNQHRHLRQEASDLCAAQHRVKRREDQCPASKRRRASPWITAWVDTVEGVYVCVGPFQTLRTARWPSDPGRPSLSSEVNGPALSAPYQSSSISSGDPSLPAGNRAPRKRRNSTRTGTQWRSCGNRRRVPRQPRARGRGGPQRITCAERINGEQGRTLNGLDP